MYVKNTKTGMIDNMDEKELRSFETMRERVKREKKLTQDMHELQTELNDLKILFKQAVERLPNVSINS